MDDIPVEGGSRLGQRCGWRFVALSDNGNIDKNWP
jgi:hypothetical protein